MRNTPPPWRRAITSGQILALPALLLMCLGCVCTFPQKAGVFVGPEQEIQLAAPSPPVATDRLTVFSESGEVLWDCVAEDCLARANFPFRYGRVPRGFRQLVPRIGAPPPIGEWQNVIVVISDRYQRGNSEAAVLTRFGEKLFATPYLFNHRPSLDSRVEALLGDRSLSR